MRHGRSPRPGDMRADGEFVVSLRRTSSNLSRGTEGGPTKTAGQRLGRFELLMELSHGGMATLYLARMTGPQTFQKLVALKRIHEHLSKEPEFVQMFLDEARIAANIEHPNVASIFDLGESQGSYYMAMEYVHGENLRDIIRASVQQRRLLPWPFAVKIVADAARGLHAAHELRNAEGTPLGVVHRDVSPQNILVSYDGHTKVIDFGVAYAAERVSHTQDGTVKGKLAYMSPEQVAGHRVDRRSDIFSLGIVLYESLCFRRLFKKDSPTATMTAVSRAEVPRVSEIRPGLPDHIDAIVHKALAADPSRRFQTAAEFAQVLEQLLAENQHFVTQEEQSRLVQTLFADKKAQRDAEIQQALRRPPGKAPTKSALLLTEPSGTGFTAGTSFFQKSNSSGKAAWIALMVAGGMLIAMGAYFVGSRFYRTSQHEKTSQRPPTAGLPASPSRPVVHNEQPANQTATRAVGHEMVRLHILVQPAVLPGDARPTITVEGRDYHAGDVNVFVPKNDQPVVIEAKAQGFHPTRSMVVPMKDLSTTIKLTPIKKAGVGRTRKGRPRGIKEQWFKEPD